MKTFSCTILILFLLVMPCYAGFKTKNQIKKGNALYNNGKFNEALKEYEEALRVAPDSDIVNFDLGTALYKTEDYKRAVEHFQRSLVSDRESIEQRASYNLGNAKYKFGISKEDKDLASAVELTRESLRHYERAIELDSKDEDAKHNYEFVQKELKRLEEKLQQQSEKQQQDSKEQEKEEEKKQDSPQQQQDSQQQQQQSQQQQSQQDKSEEGSGQEQEQQQPQQPDEREQEEEKAKDSASQKEQKEQKEAAVQQAGEMSEKEASMLLEGYRNEEEPKGLYKGNIPTHGLPRVLKDW